MGSGERRHRIDNDMVSHASIEQTVKTNSASVVCFFSLHGDGIMRTPLIQLFCRTAGPVSNLCIMHTASNNGSADSLGVGFGGVFHVFICRT